MKFFLPPTGAVSVVIALLCIASVDAADPVRISVTNQNISFLPAGAALKMGYFRDEGLDVEIIRMNTPNTVTALMTGDIGYTLLLGSIVRAALRGMPLKVTASCSTARLTRLLPGVKSNPSRS